MKITALLLAAGKGKRMYSRNPKVLHKVNGKPLIFYSLKLLSQLPINDIQVVIGYRKALVKSAVLAIAKELKFKQKVSFKVQNKMLGTGNAVSIALDRILPDSTDILVINGDDSCFYKPATINKVLALHTKRKSNITFVTLQVQDPTGLGRILRDKKGRVSGVVEEKAATPVQKMIREVNDGVYIFEKKWLLDNINKLKMNASGEYYLTDLIGMGIIQKMRVTAYTLQDNSEWVGINTKEELKRANELAKIMELTR